MVIPLPLQKHPKFPSVDFFSAYQSNGELILPQTRHIKATELEEVPYKKVVLTLNRYRAPAPFTGYFPFDYTWDAYENEDGAIGSPMTKRFWSDNERKARGYF